MESTALPWRDRPLRAVTQKCAQNFNKAVLGQPQDSSQRTELSNQLDRLKIWAGDMGVVAAEKASADYRLRHNQNIMMAMTMLINRINRQLETLISTPKKLQQRIRKEESTSDSSDSISESSSDDSNERPGKAPLNAQTQHPTRLEVSSRAITDLHRLSAVIKKPEHQNDASKIERYAEKISDKTELEELASSVRWKLRQLFPDLAPFLFDRLVNSVVFGRQKIMYRRSHAEKLREGVPETFGLLVRTELPETSFKSSLQRARLSAPLQTISSLNRNRKIAASATTASSINFLKVPAYPKSVALSHIPSRVIHRRNSLDIPPAPKPATGSIEVACVYCSMLVKEAVTREPHWT